MTLKFIFDSLKDKFIFFDFIEETSNFKKVPSNIIIFMIYYSKLFFRMRKVSYSTMSKLEFTNMLSEHIRQVFFVAVLGSYIIYISFVSSYYKKYR